jgi:hypothetical protein
MNYFGLSCVCAILLVALLSVTTLVNGVTERRKQAQVDGITRIGILNSSDMVN